MKLAKRNQRGLSRVELLLLVPGLVGLGLAWAGTAMGIRSAGLIQVVILFFTVLAVVFWVHRKKSARQPSEIPPAPRSPSPMPIVTRPPEPVREGRLPFDEPVYEPSQLSIFREFGAAAEFADPASPQVSSRQDIQSGMEPRAENPSAENPSTVSKTHSVAREVPHQGRMLIWLSNSVLGFSVWFVSVGSFWLIGGMNWRRYDLKIVVFLYVLIVCGTLYLRARIFNRRSWLAVAIGVGLGVTLHDRILWSRLADVFTFFSFLALPSVVFVGFWARRRMAIARRTGLQPVGARTPAASDAIEMPDIHSTSHTSNENHLIGEVRSFQPYQESGSKANIQIWTFKLERFDADGNALSPVPVEMRARSFAGFINEGDRVEIFKRMKPGRLVRPKRLYNLTTNSEVYARTLTARIVRLLLLR